METIHFCEIGTPLGKMHVASTQKGIAMFEFPIEARIAVHKRQLLEMFSPTPESPNELINELAYQISAYFSKDITEFTIPLDFVGSEFQKNVWKALIEIPFGKTITYSELATKLGGPKSIRAVASANGQNKLPILVPCHRVISSQGGLTGYSGELWRKEFLLELEHGQSRLSF